MTLNELIAQLTQHAANGYGDLNIVIYDEDEGITKDIQEIELWNSSGNTPPTIDINVGR